MGAMVNRRDVMKLLGAGALSLGATRLHAAAGRRKAPRGAPNIVFIMTDDHAQRALSAYGDPILKTPNLDRIGAEGIRFNLAFVTNSLCAPSRASFLTGLYSHAHGVITNGEEPGWYEQQGLARDQVTYPMLLRRAGYHTAVVGKWHIKSPPTGFDHWAVLPGQGMYFDPEMVVNGTSTKVSGHTDDAIGDQALAYLRGRPQGVPFCLLYQFKAPHGPWEPAPRFAGDFKDVEIPIPRAFDKLPEGIPEAVHKTQMAVAGMGDFHKREGTAELPPERRKYANLQALVKNYYRVLRGVDENVGRVLEFLDQNGLAGNTIVLYTSDNGFFLGELGLYDKRLMYEPSIRVPMLLRWPAGGIRPGQVDSDHMVLNVDVAPTFLDLAGVAVPGWMHGRSWKPIVVGAKTKTRRWRDAFLYEYFEYPAVHCVRKHRGVRTARWKLIHFWQQPEEWALYDLQEDPDEMVNLAARPEHAARISELRRRMGQLRRQTGDVDPPGYMAPKLEPGKCPA